MKKAIFCSLFLLIFAVTTCNSDQDNGLSKIYIDFGYSKGQISNSRDLQGSTFPSDIYYIRVAVYEGDVADSNRIYNKTFGKDVNEATISVISGPARILTIEALSVTKDPLYRGVSEPTDLVPDTTVTIPVTMAEVPFETASITINLRNMDDTYAFNWLDVGALIGNQATISVFTSAIEGIENLDISCDLAGDYSNTNYNPLDFPVTMNVPAATFIIVVLRGDSSAHSADGFLGVLGATVILASALEPDSTDNQINIKVLNCDTTVDPIPNLEADDSNGAANGWFDVCECTL